MENKIYHLRYLPIFEQDLISTASYITNVLKNEDAALRLIDDVEAAILERLNNPLAFEPYVSAKKRDYPYYRIYVRNYVIYYVVIDDVMEVTTKPIILDGDTGGLVEHFVYNVRTLERMGVSAVIIEDKTGLKKNSLFGTEVKQTQDSIENFCAKIRAGKQVLRTEEFMIIARIESLILERGMEDALNRARAYVAAGADGIMIHSRKKSPDEILEFCHLFRQEDAKTPIVVVPTSFNSITEEELSAAGVNIVIYANQLTRSAFPAMQSTAVEILKNHRALEVDSRLMPFKDIIRLIDEI